jgi:chaperonin GroEL
VNVAPQECVLERPYILFCEREVLQADARTPNSPMNLLPLMEKVAPTGRPLLVVAEKTGGDALTMLIYNVRKGTLSSCAVAAPGVGARRKECLRDLAQATGGEVYSPDAGNSMAKFELRDLGTCAVAIIHPDRTELIEVGAEHAEKTKPQILAAIEKRAEELKILRAATDDDYEKEQLSQRIGRLTDGVVILHVGANTMGELNERKARVQDAVYSARAAKAEGVVPGGGIVLLKAARAIEEKLATETMSDARRMGAKILAKALEAPLRQIAENAGISPDVAIAKVKQGSLSSRMDLTGPHRVCGFESEGAALLQGVGPQHALYDVAEKISNFGLNAATGEYGDLVEAGIVDPLKVVRVALEKAASITVLVLTSEAAVCPLPAPPPANANPQQPERG